MWVELEDTMVCLGELEIAMERLGKEKGDRV